MARLKQMTRSAGTGSELNGRPARKAEFLATRHQTRKDHQWHFGTKVHVGADSRSGLIHSASVMAANVHAQTVFPTCHMATRRGFAVTAPIAARHSGSVPRSSPPRRGTLPTSVPTACDANRRRQGRQLPKVEHPGQGRASLPDPQALVGNCQGAPARTG